VQRTPLQETQCCGEQRDMAALAKLSIVKRRATDSKRPILAGHRVELDARYLTLLDA